MVEQNDPTTYTLFFENTTYTLDSITFDTRVWTCWNSPKKKNAWHDMTHKIFAPGNEAHGMKITRKIFYTKILIKFEFNGV